VGISALNFELEEWERDTKFLSSWLVRGLVGGGEGLSFVPDGLGWLGGFMSLMFVGGCVEDEWMVGLHGDFVCFMDG
jgi:hypothetical protein